VRREVTKTGWVMIHARRESLPVKILLGFIALPAAWVGALSKYSHGSQFGISGGQ
jgi:hypothetical protein